MEIHRCAAIFALVAVLPLACVSAEGWQRTQARTCAPPDPPRLCFDAEPDRPLTLELGPLRLVPGECAEASEQARGGSVRVALRDAAGRARARSVSLARGSVTTLVVDAAGRARARSTRCTASPGS